MENKVEKQKKFFSLSSGLLATAFLNIAENVTSNHITYIDLQTIISMFEINLKANYAFKDLDFDPIFLSTPFFELDTDESTKKSCRKMFSPFVTRYGDTNPSVNTNFYKVTEQSYHGKPKLEKNEAALIQRLKDAAISKHNYVTKETKINVSSRVLLSNLYYFEYIPTDSAEKSRNLYDIAFYLEIYLKNKGLDINVRDILRALKHSVKIFQQYKLDQNVEPINQLLLKEKKVYDDFEIQEIDIFA